MASHQLGSVQTGAQKEIQRPKAMVCKTLNPLLRMCPHDEDQRAMEPRPMPALQQGRGNYSARCPMHPPEGTGNLELKLGRTRGMDVIPRNGPFLAETNPASHESMARQPKHTPRTNNVHSSEEGHEGTIQHRLVQLPAGPHIQTHRTISTTALPENSIQANRTEVDGCSD